LEGGGSTQVPLDTGLTHLAGLARELADLGESRAVQEAVLSALEAMFGCLGAAVCHWDARSECLRPGLARGEAAGADLARLGEAATVRARVIEGRETFLAEPAPLLVPLAAAEEGGDGGAEGGGDDGSGWAVRAVVPVVGRRDLLGVLAVGEPAEAGAYEGGGRALLETVAAVLAMAVETGLVHARFRAEMQRRMDQTLAELGRASAELAQLKTFTDDLFQSLPVGIVVFDRSWRVTFRNAAARRLWPEDLHVLEAARRTDLARVDPEWELGLREVLDMRRPWFAEMVTFCRAGEEPTRVNVAASPLMSEQKGVVGGVLVIEDVTQRVRMERRLEVSERLAGVGRLAAVVAHEINNPLDGMRRLLGLAMRAAEAGETDRLAGYLPQVRKGLDRIGAIVRDLLDFSRGASASAEPMPIRDILTEAVRTLEPTAEAEGVAVEVACQDDLPPLRSGHLYHAVLNLVKNAVEATPRGGRVEVRARCEAGALVIEVADTGPGIPPEVLPRLFEPFYSSKALGKGTGLGLVISRDLVQRQGGTLSAANRPEGGAVFTIRVPLAPSGEG